MLAMLNMNIDILRTYSYVIYTDIISTWQKALEVLKLRNSKNIVGNIYDLLYF